MVGEEIERRVDIGLVVESRGRRAERSQPVAALAIVGQQAMDVAAGDPAIRRSPRPRAGSSRRSSGLPRAGRAADVHLVAFERHARVLSPVDLDQHLVALEHRVDVEQAEARRPSTAGLRCLADRRRCGRASDSRRRCPAHGRRAAHGPARSMSQPACAQGREIGDGGLRAGQDDQRGIAGDRLARAARRPDRRPAPAAADRSRRSWRCADRRARRSSRPLPRCVVGRPSASSAGRRWACIEERHAGRAPASRCACAMSLHAVVEQRRDRRGSG